MKREQGIRSLKNNSCKASPTLEDDRLAHSKRTDYSVCTNPVPNNRLLDSFANINSMQQHSLTMRKQIEITRDFCAMRIGVGSGKHPDRLLCSNLSALVYKEKQKTIFIVAFRASLRRMTNFNIDIVSDTVCPWCYVGKKRLEKGIAAYKERHPESNDTFSTNWFPYYLQPDAGKSVDKQAMYESKFGKERTAMMQQRLSEIGREMGINFKYGGKTGNTRDSHRLIQLGKTKGSQVQTRVIEELFAAYFENEKDITSREVLSEAGVKAGLTEEEIKDWLESGKGGPEVDKEVQRAQRQGISSVPNYTINGKFEVAGAQDADAFVQLFERVKKQDGGL
ncbi:hypothetical protein J1614_010440 [Plenodomus biglobosus]|nr:hypothetical protein J1614_010440 [Plenodomus biglobosus]